ncbi:MAG: tetratricopeptide repeat protein [Bdellovibrionales bacterium]
MAKTATSENQKEPVAPTEFEIIAADLKANRVDPITVLPKLEAMADKGHPGAARIASKLYRKGKGVPVDAAKAAALTRKAAASGDRDGAYMMWRTLAKTGGKSDREALQWLLKAAERGHPRANEKLAGFYVKGIAGLRKNIGKAIAHYRRAVKRRPTALLSLAKIYLTEKGDVERAMTYLTQASEAGLAEAEYQLARLYARGRGVPRDLVKAVVLYKKAAAAGSAHAQAALVDIAVRKGRTIVDATELKAWLEASAAKNDTEAMEALGHYYFYGLQGAPDKAAAEEWYQRAARAGKTATANT